MNDFNGQQIRSKRTAEGLTAQQLAQQLQVPLSNLYKWEKGHRPQDPEQFLKIVQWLRDEPAISVGAPYLKAAPDAYTRLLERNDAFFKEQYASFNHQVLANLTVLMTYCKNLESLVKINLEHTGNIEAWQRGQAPEVCHAEINTAILNAVSL